MGCDIHLVLERKANINGVEKWVGVNNFDYINEMVNVEEKLFVSWTVRMRNYSVFAQLANVRGQTGDENEPVGIPNDASDLSLMEIDYWDGDGHSHSWLPAREFVRRYVIATEGEAAAVAARLEGTEDPLEIASQKLFGIYWQSEEHERTLDEHRVVFWFDN